LADKAVHDGKLKRSAPRSDSAFSAGSRALGARSA
jgi:hypothetical protein